MRPGSLRCGNCSSNSVNLKSAKGKLFPYKGEKMAMPLDFYLPTCNACGEMIINSKDIPQIDFVLEGEWQRKKDN